MQLPNIPKNSKILQKIHNFIKDNSLLPTESIIVIGLSGGPDSVFLTHLLKQYQKSNRLTLIAAYLDHEWRPDSKNDLEFCQNLAESLNIPFISSKVSELSCTIKPNGSQEEVARKLRRYFLQEVKKQYNADLIALAHHADDQQETFFIRLLRGATVTGLSCMKAQDKDIIRPLLCINKADIMHYLDTHKISYCIDPTNSSNKFLRNRIRSQLLPALHNIDARFAHTFAHTLKQVQKTDQFLADLTHHTFSQISTYSNNQYVINLTLFFAQHPFMQRQLILHWLIQENAPFTPSEAFIEEILRFLQSKNSGSHQLNTGWKMVKKGTVAQIHTH